MCGTPLPQRPLTAPGAQSTHTFTRVPLESAKAEPESVAAPAPPARTGLRVERTRSEPRGVEALRTGKSVAPTAVEMVPEVPLDEYIKNFRYDPPADPAEITMRGDAPVLQVEPLVAADAGATISTEAPPVVGASSGVSTDDVRDRLGLEDEAPESDRHDRPRFLDFSEPAPAAEKHITPQPVTGGPSPLGLSDKPQFVAEAKDGQESSKPRRSGWTWFAAAVLLIVAALGGLEWRSRVYHTNNGPLEVVMTRLLNIRRSYNQVPESPSSTAANAPQPGAQTEEPAKSQVQDQAATANPNLPSAPAASKLPASNTAAGAPGANPQQHPAEANGKQPIAATKLPASMPGSSPSGVQPATGQKAAQVTPTPPTNSSKVATVTQTSGVTPNAADKPRPKPPSTPADGQEAAFKKAVPGDEELTKANNASDSVAAAAWLWKATAKGNPEAPVRLADLYIKGDGVPRSCEQALVLLNSAAAKDNARARNRLASMYKSGTCVQRNRVEAYRWLSSALAADPNSDWARQNRDLIWQQMTPEERAVAQPDR